MCCVLVIHRNWLRSNSANAGYESQRCFVTCTLYILTCAMTKTRKEERQGEIFSCQLELSGYGFWDVSWAAPQPQYDITLPSVLSGEMICSEDTGICNKYQCNGSYKNLMTSSPEAHLSSSTSGSPVGCLVLLSLSQSYVFIPHASLWMAVRTRVDSNWQTTCTSLLCLPK